VVFGGGSGAPTENEPPVYNPPQSPPAGASPVITVTLSPELNLGGCINYSDFAGGSLSPCSVDVNVSIAGGVSGVGTLSVALQGATQVGTGWKGMANEYTFSGITWLPGGTITATVTYVDAASVTHTQTGSFTFPNFCGPPTGIQISGFVNTGGGTGLGSSYSVSVTTTGPSTGSLDVHQLTLSAPGATPVTTTLYPGQIQTVSFTFSSSTMSGWNTMTANYADPPGPFTTTETI